ncbi:uncharacterized protein BP01DRAFT_407503 [Aspergillus saccharolyticus JOP 1030-1]|uniref:DUF7702 domain-containing protein n=1 Tax=Aspergillus saccharolyticus JOP 1030-1 TaxID=1450539 RepID=A0A318ZKJ8_9EURO|nr:hypothetical protein BP01DRAFT_407503 [Aspergillus saccharolyticus JOP 1030-1]PYH48036.1 hypothetical protein BP01DRAFT_407503 [Aspergillus saccharolyticus JOP 1030-1]
MGTVTYRDGIAILQLIIFPFIVVAALFIWNRTGWKAGSKIWRFAVTLSLIRIAGSISSLLTINNDSYNVEVAVAVCELIGIAPLLLTYVGLLRQIDTQQSLPPRLINGVAIICVIGLILGIAGVSSASDNGTYHPDSIVKASMGIFLAVFVIILLLTYLLFVRVRPTMRVFQKKLFLAIACSCPLLVVRLVYSALGDFTTDSRFTVLVGSPTIYLCMDVLEEIFAMIITMVLAVSAVLEKDFVQPGSIRQPEEGKIEGV